MYKTENFTCCKISL